jgi:hypothetical protein
LSTDVGVTGALSLVGATYTYGRAYGLMLRLSHGIEDIMDGAGTTLLFNRSQARVYSEIVVHYELLQIVF